MKKLFLVATAFVALCVCSCGNDDATLRFRGISLNQPVSQFVDSLAARGFSVDSAASDSGSTLVLASPTEKCRLLVAYKGDVLLALQENYSLSSNDSTRRLWQELRDGFEQELGTWPDCPVLKDNRKEANFEAEGGFISVMLENTYTPNVRVRYTPKRKK